MSGQIFRFVFILVSFMALWFQPSEFSNPQPFFTSFFIVVGSLWVNTIATAVEQIKVYWDIKNCIKIETCTYRLIVLEYILKMISFFCGLILFLFSMAGIVGYLGFEEMNQGNIKYSENFSVINIEGMLQESVLDWLVIPVSFVAGFSVFYLLVEMAILVISFLTHSWFYNSYEVKKACLDQMNAVKEVREAQELRIVNDKND